MTRLILFSKTLDVLGGEEEEARDGVEGKSSMTIFYYFHMYIAS